jgi:hypothetical protein
MYENVTGYELCCEIQCLFIESNVEVQEVKRDFLLTHQPLYVIHESLTSKGQVMTFHTPSESEEFLHANTIEYSTG